MDSVSSTSISNNHKLYFSKSELSKILNCYSIGVSNGNWKDYALNFNGGGGGHNGFSESFGAGDSSTSYLFTGSCQINFRGGDGHGGNRDPLHVCALITGDN